MNDIASLVKSVTSVNTLIGTINKSLAQAAKTGTTPVQQKKVEHAAEKIEKAKDDIVATIKKEEPQQTASTVDYWGDPRMNPVFLHVADFFGIDQREYPIASSKINEIIRWAETETKSKDVSKIIRKIGETSRSLQSPGLGEKRYAILYRYIKLSRQKNDLEKEMNIYRK